jgi:hypothetical protein
MLWPAPPLFASRRMAKKAATTTVKPKAPMEIEIVEAEWSNKGDKHGQRLPKRRDLLMETIQAFRKSLKTDKPNSTTVGHLLQLMKLYKELIDEDEKPTHIQLIWNDLEEELYD